MTTEDVSRLPHAVLQDGWTWLWSEHGWGARQNDPDAASVGYSQDGIWTDGAVPENVMRAVLVANEYERQRARAQAWREAHPDLNGEWHDDLENDPVGWAELHDPVIHAAEAWFVEKTKDPDVKPISMVPWMAMFFAFRQYRRALLTAFVEQAVAWRSGPKAIGEFLGSADYGKLLDIGSKLSWPESKQEVSEFEEKHNRLAAYIKWADAQVLAAARGERKIP